MNGEPAPRQFALPLRYAAAIALHLRSSSVPGLLAVHHLLQDAGGDLHLPARLVSQAAFSSPIIAVLFKDGDAFTVWNSLVLAGISTFIAMVLGTICAYSLARFRTGGENLAMWIISQRMMPPIADRVPDLPALRLARLGRHLSRADPPLHGLQPALRDLDDARLYRGHSARARGERAGRWLHAAGRCCGRWCFRWSRTGLFATAVFTFVFAWNDFLFALVLTRTEVITYTVQVTHYFGGQSNFWAKIAAMSVLGTVPIFIAVALMQRYPRARHLDGRGQGVEASAWPISRSRTAQELRTVQARQRHRPRRSRRRVHRAGRSVRLRQEHAAADHRRPRGRPTRARSRSAAGGQSTCARATATSRWCSRTTRSIPI